MGRSMRVRKEVDYSDPGELSLAEIRRGAPSSASRADQSHANSTDSQKSKTKKPETPVQGSPKVKLKERPKAKASAEVTPQNPGKESDKRRSSGTAGKSINKAGRKASEAPSIDGPASAPKDAKLTKPDRSERVTKPTPHSNHALPAKRLSPTKPSTPTKRTSLAKSSVPPAKVTSAPPKMTSAATKPAASRQAGTGSTTGKRPTETRGDRSERPPIKRPRGRPSASVGEVVVGGTDAGKGKENTALESEGNARKEVKGSQACDNEGGDKDNSHNPKVIGSPRKSNLLSLRGSKSPPNSKASASRPPPEPVGDTSSAFDLPDGSGEEDEPELRPQKTRVVSMADNEDDTPTPPQFPRRQARVSPRKTPAAPRGRDGNDDVPSRARTTENRRDTSSGKAGDRGKSIHSDTNARPDLKPSHAPPQPPPAPASARSPSKLASVSRRSVEGASTGADRSRKSDGETTVTAGRNTPSKRQRTVVTQSPSTPGLGVPAIPPRVPRSIPPPGTPAVTQAQEQFISELRALLGSIGGDVASSGNDAADARDGSDPAGSSADPRGSEGRSQRDQEKKKLSEEVEYWKGRFEELSSLRETVPEMQLELFREHAAMREQAAQELIDHLRKQVSGARGTGVPVPGTTAKNTSSTPDSCLVPPPPSLPSQTPGRRARLPEPALTEDELEADHPLSSPRSSAYVRSLEDKLEYHRKVIRLYQNLSSLAIQVQPEPRRTRGEGGQDEDGDGEVMTCTAVNHLHRRAVRFDLRVPGDEDAEDFMYRATGNRHLLPEYMQHELSFTKKQCPLFLTKLLQNLFRS